MNKSYPNTRLSKAVPFHCELIDGYYQDCYSDIVKRMFELRLQGLGAPTIASRLNEEFTPPKTVRSGSFSQHLVHRLLKDPSLIGELHTKTETIENYFPSAIDKETFAKVNQAVFFNNGRRKVGGSSNVLKGVARCSKCGNGLTVKTSNSRYRALQCIKRNKGCDSGAVRLSDVLLVILTDMIVDEGIKKRFEDYQERSAILEELLEQKTLLEEAIGNVISKVQLEALLNALDDLDKRIAFNRSVSTGKFDNILETVDYTSADGKRAFQILLQFLYSSIEVDLSNAAVSLVDAVTGELRTQSRQWIDSRVWKVKGLQEVLFKEGTSPDDEFISHAK